jgi:hypothetical protein
MKRVTLSEADPEDGAVFVDNVALSAVARILTGGYDSLPTSYFEHPASAQLLFAHDLVNLAGILEALVCHEQLYVNADFADTWINLLQSQHSALTNAVTGVVWTKDFQWHAESSIVKSDWPRRQDGGLLADARDEHLTAVVSASTHHAGKSGRIVEFDDSLNELTDYRERTRPFGRGMDIIVGTGFYTTCSQILGIPFRPSALRANYLRGILNQLIRDFREDVGRGAFQALEMGRETAVAATAFTAHMAELNLIDTAVPAVLTAILARASSREDVIPATLELRASASAQKFREWNSALVRSIQTGDLKDAAKRAGEINRIVKDVNRSFGLESPQTGYISVGWGPVGAGKTFDLPQRLNLPIRFSRHAWFLQRMYASMLSIARIEDSVDRLFVRPLSRQFRQWLDEADGLEWNSIIDRFESTSTIYRPS